MRYSYKATKKEPHFNSTSEIPDSYKQVHEYISKMYGSTYYYAVADWEDSQFKYRHMFTCSELPESNKLTHGSGDQKYYTQTIVKILHVGGPLDGTLTCGDFERGNAYYHGGYKAAKGYMLIDQQNNLTSLGGVPFSRRIAIYLTDALIGVLPQ